MPILWHAVEVWSMPHKEIMSEVFAATGGHRRDWQRLIKFGSAFAARPRFSKFSCADQIYGSRQEYVRTAIAWPAVRGLPEIDPRIAHADFSAAIMDCNWSAQAPNAFRFSAARSY